MKNIYLPQIIRKLKRRTKKIIYIDSLKSVIQEVMGEEYLDKRAYKILYYLKKKWRLISLKKSIFFIKDPETVMSEEEITEQYYRQLLHKHCNHVAWKNRYVWWLKALQIQFMDLSIPERIQIVTQNQQRQEVVVSEKIIQFKKYTARQELLFKKFKKYTIKQKLRTNTFLVASKELAVLEVLYSFDSFDNQFELEYVKKALKKYKNRDVTIRENILKIWKHHTSINRLHQLLVQVQPKAAEQLMESIKKYGFVL